MLCHANCEMRRRRTVNSINVTRTIIIETKHASLFDFLASVQLRCPKHRVTIVLSRRQIRALREKISNTEDGAEKTAMRKELKALYDHSVKKKKVLPKETAPDRYAKPCTCNVVALAPPTHAAQLECGVVLA